MKRFRSTGILAGFVALLAAYTLWEFKHAAEDEQTERGERRLFQLVRDDLDEIQLSAKGQVALLKKTGNGWRMVKPLDDDADSSAVEGFIFSLLTQKGKVFRNEDEKETKWSDYGLEPPGSVVEVRGHGRSEQLEVSSKHAFDGSYYIRSNKELLLGDRGLAQLVERDPNSFRSRKIYRGPEELSEVQVALDSGGGSETYTLKKSDDKEKNVWTMTPSPGFPIDSNKVTVWVQKLVGLTASDFAADNPSAEERMGFLLAKPSFVVKMTDSILTFGQNRAEDVFVATNKRPTIYKIPSVAADTLRVAKAYFRDGHVPFKFNLEQVREIEVQTEKFKSAFVKKDSSWEIKTPVKDSELDPDKLVTLFQNIQSLEAVEWGGVGTGFPAAPQIVMKGADGHAVFGLTWGAEATPKNSYNKSTPLRWVRVIPSQETYAVSKDRLDRLIDSAMIKKKKESK